MSCLDAPFAARRPLARFNSLRVNSGRSCCKWLEGEVVRCDWRDSSARLPIFVTVLAPRQMDCQRSTTGRTAAKWLAIMHRLEKRKDLPNDEDCPLRPRNRPQDNALLVNLRMSCVAKPRVSFPACREELYPATADGFRCPTMRHWHVNKNLSMRV
jgi:hypothetical protein